MNKISKAVVTRLPRYYRYLDELRQQNVERISSKELSKLMNVTASQIRQDLNNFGGFGQQGYGYSIGKLRDEIAAILKKHHVSCDADVLQDRYRRQLGQRLMASLRDASGEREVLSNGRGRYVVLECCRDRQQLAAIRRRIQNQAHGLNASAGKVRARIAVLDRLIACLRKAA